MLFVYTLAFNQYEVHYTTIPQKANNPTGLQNPSAWARNDLGLSFASFGQAKEEESYMPNQAIAQPRSYSDTLL